MKYLENPSLEAFSSKLSVEASGNCKLDIRLESYSCKMVQSDKKQWKRECQMGSNPRDLQPLSPLHLDDEPWTYSPSQNSVQYGSSVPSASSNFLEPSQQRLRHRSDRSFSNSDVDLGAQAPVYLDSISRKALFDLKAVLNISFPDYDFSDAKSDTFSLVPKLEIVFSSIDQKVTALFPGYTRIRDELWRTIDEEIKFSDCHIYSYNPDYSSLDPFSEDGCIWSFNFFFHNKSRKRVLFFSCRALRYHCPVDLSDEQLWSMEDE